jgi:hypothetical protein
MAQKKSKTQKRLSLWRRKIERMLAEIPATEYPNIIKEAERLCADARATGTATKTKITNESLSSAEMRIQKVSEMVEIGMCEGVLGFRSPDLGRSERLERTEEVLDPTLKQLEQATYRMIKKHNLDDALINALRFTQSDLAYTIGIIAGLHMAGKADLVPAFAAAYATNPIGDNNEAFDEDGARA